MQTSLLCLLDTKTNLIVRGSCDEKNHRQTYCTFCGVIGFNLGCGILAWFTSQWQYEKVRVWAQALAERDGLARYKMMTGDMQRQFVENQKEYIGDENWNFVIGYSSPQTVGFDIVSLGDTAFITYHQTDSTGEMYTVREKLTFTGEKNSRLVSSCESLQ